MRANSRVRRWTPQEDEVLRSMILAGRQPAQVATKLQRSVQSVYARGYVLRLPFKRIKLRSNGTVSE
jgi:hypothetical protein